MEKTIRCPFCSEEILETAKKCKHCGEWIDLSARPPVTYTTITPTSVNEALSAKFKIISEAGKGGMAVVYKAVQKNLNRTVGLKVLLPQYTSDQEYVERFHREARSAAMLSHPNIITIYDEGVENGVHYISMEYLEGIDLHQRIKQSGILSSEELIGIIVPMADALDYAHKRGIVHRDIKNANIFLHKDGRIILTDFGIARSTQGTQLTMRDAVMGTPEFMSPEQADGKEIDGKSDIYSLGVVMYYSLTGRFPYSGDNPLTTIYKILHEKYMPIKNIKSVPEWLESIIDVCLEKDPRERIKTGKELRELIISKKTIRRIMKPAENSHATIKVSKTNIESKPITAERGNKKPLNQKSTPLIYNMEKEAKKKNLTGILSLITVLALVLLTIILIQSGQNSSPLTTQGKTQEHQNNQSDQTPTQQSSNDNNQNQLYGNEITQQQTAAVEKVQKEPTVIESVRVPDLTNMQLEAAKKIISLNSLRIGIVSQIPGPSQVDQIIRQIPKAGAAVKKGTAINLFVGE